MLAGPPGMVKGVPQLYVVALTVDAQMTAERALRKRDRAFRRDICVMVKISLADLQYANTDACGRDDKTPLSFVLNALMAMPGIYKIGAHRVQLFSMHQTDSYQKRASRLAAAARAFSRSRRRETVRFIRVFPKGLRSGLALALRISTAPHDRYHGLPPAASSAACSSAAKRTSTTSISLPVSYDPKRCRLPERDRWRRDLLRWMEIPDVQTAYRDARRAAFGQSIARLQQASTAAVSTLLKIMG